MIEKFKSFLSKILKLFIKNKSFQKKKFLSVALVILFIAVIVSVPVHQAHASLVDIGKKFLADGLNYLMNDGIDIVRNFIYAVAFAILSIFLSLSKYLVNFGAWCIDATLDQRLYTGNPPPGVLTSNTVTVGWTTVRDMCNTFYMFFLLIIAFGTILRSSTFNAKNLLPKLVISLLLINFSMVIAKLVIDFGQVFMYEILGWMGSFQEGGSSLTSVVDKFDNMINIVGAQASLDQVIMALFAVAYSLVLGFTYIMLAGFLLIRLVAFVFLIILSPIAFLSIAMPSMSKYTSRWWSELVKYSLFGPIFIFFVFLSATMANELVGNFTPLATTNSGFDAVSDVLVLLITYSIPLFMLLAVIPVTQELGMAGANKIIGGTAGIGKIAMGTFAGAKLAAGLGKKAVGAPVGRAHSYMKGRSEKYNKLSSGVSGTLKKLPITGRIALKYEAAQKQKNNEAVTQKEKLMETMTDKDKKNYVDSFKFDRNAKAEAQQAMFNLLAKDNGKGLTNDRLQKMGYEKEVAGKQVFDKGKFESDYGRAAAHGMDTSNIEKYRPDLIKDKGDRIDKIKKIALDGDEKKIKLDVLADEDSAKALEGEIGSKRYKDLINSKSQEEKDGLLKLKEDKLIKRGQLYLTNPADPKGLNLSAPPGTVHRKEIQKYQEEIAGLASSKDKSDKMKDIKGLDIHGDLEHKAVININMAKNVIGQMSKDQFLDLDSDFLKEQGDLISESVLKHIDKFGKVEQLRDIREAVIDEITRGGGATAELQAKLNFLDRVIS